MDFTIIVPIAVLCLVAGAVGGVFIGRSSSAAARQAREAEQRVQELEQRHQQYKEDVLQHFTETGQLLNNLTRSYSEVHQHLARGADELCDGEAPVSLPEINVPDKEIPHSQEEISPPLDYAPKTSPDEPGMLNEKFGLDETPPPPQREEKEKEEEEPKLSEAS